MRQHRGKRTQRSRGRSGKSHGAPPLTFAVLNQQLVPSNTPAAQPERASQSEQHCSLVVAAAAACEPLP